MKTFLVSVYIIIKGIEYTYKQNETQESFDDYFDAKKYAIDLTQKVKAKNTIIRVEELIGNEWQTCFEIKN